MGGLKHTVTQRACVLIISHDVVDARMAGPGIRYWELARVLARHFDVLLAVPGDPSLPDSNLVTLWPYRPGRWGTLVQATEQANAILLCGDVLVWFPELQEIGVPLIVDGYDPHPMETLALFAGSSEQSQRHRESARILRAQCRAGDFFICASERQRDWWLGWLGAAGRVNPHTYSQDPSLRKLIDVVPYGLPSTPPHHTQQVLKGVWSGIAAEDKVLLWGGGLWQWLDPLTAVRAMALMRERRDDVRLVFPGTRHPNPAVPDMPMREDTVRLAEELSLMNKYVFFGEWVPYEDWSNYLLEADVGLSLHFDTVETRLAFRSRILDYVWAGLPMVVTEGDVISQEIAHFGLGEVIGYGREQELTAAVIRLLDKPRLSFDRAFGEAQRVFTWERAAEPLAEFCAHPRLAPDTGAGAKQELWLGASDAERDAKMEALHTIIADQKAKIDRLQDRLAGYEQGRFIRMMKWLDDVRPWKVKA